ncbi:MAG: sporulation protein YunB [Clostridiales bacterium]|nr:sporulation protein YunB [Clostridiales bacterium]
MRRRKNKGKAGTARRRGRLLLLVGLLLGLCGAVAFVTDAQLRPAMIAMVSSELQNTITVKTAEVWETLEEESGVSLSDALQLHYASDGSIAAVSMDADTLNRLGSALSTRLTEVLSGMERETVEVPLGTALEFPLFSGLGPDVQAEILNVGHVTAEFDSAFQDAGINQTIYSVNLLLTAEVILLLPGGTYTLEVETVLPVAETILLGDVPQEYVSVSGTHSASDSLAEE